jgi:GNAT superfamily N-acetyltransferase
VNFHPIEANLRQSFRTLAAGRPNEDVVELPGVSIASLGVAFQMFNAAFLNETVSTQWDLATRVATVREHFERRGTGWSFWFCEDWLERPVRRRLAQVCGTHGLRIASELPGMLAEEVAKQKRRLPALEFRRAQGASTLSDFRTVGAACFHVPAEWFAEVFNDEIGRTSPDFACWVGYYRGLPVTTAAVLVSGGAIGLYNIATVPLYRGRGMAEAITRHVVDVARQERGPLPVVLQSTSLGRTMYDRMGFREATRIVVFNSVE